MRNKEEFCGKIILFGEYTVIVDGRTLAIPSRNYAGIWKHNVDNSIDLLPYFNFLKENLSDYLDVTRILQDHKKGLSFVSDIPMGYGLGSSGALVAATYGRYRLTDGGSIEKLRKILGTMESYFHGQSSGTDPLVSYMGVPLLMEKNKIREENISEETLASFRLIDSKIARQSEPQVLRFIELMKNETYKAQLAAYQTMVSIAIAAVLNNDNKQLESSMRDISMAQLELFHEMIPEGILELWEEGLDKGAYSMKLCGAGGGGMFLLYLHGSEEGLKDFPYSISYL